MTSTLLFAAGIVGFIIIVVLFLSFVSMSQRKKQTEKQNHYFSKAAADLGITVHKKDTLRDRIIGCDEQVNHIIFTDYSRQPQQQTLIKLKDTTGSRLIINNDTVTENTKEVQKTREVFTSSVLLRVQFKNDQLMPADLTFYKYGIDSFHDLEDLKRGAETWNDLINKNSG